MAFLLEGTAARLQAQAPVVLDSLVNRASTSGDGKVRLEAVRLEAVRLFLESVGMLDSKFGDGIESTDADELETSRRLKAKTSKFSQQLAATI